eukprot:3042083-Alexandrium_andersonii.AAC.1
MPVNECSNLHAQCNGRHMQHDSASIASYTNSSRCAEPLVRHDSPRARHEWKMGRDGGDASAAEAHPSARP